MISTLPAILLAATLSSTAPVIVELGSSQSMCIAGKGPGQDATLNPYAKVASNATVENLGGNPFSVRIQEGDDILRLRSIAPGKSRRFSLRPGQQLYFDSELPTRAKVTYAPAESQQR